MIKDKCRPGAGEKFSRGEQEDGRDGLKSQKTGKWVGVRGAKREQSVINKEDWLDNNTWFCQTRKQESEDESAPGVIREVPVLGQSALGLASRGLDSSTPG